VSPKVVLGWRVLGSHIEMEPEMVADPEVLKRTGNARMVPMGLLDFREYMKKMAKERPELFSPGMSKQARTSRLTRRLRKDTKAGNVRRRTKVKG